MIDIELSQAKIKRLTKIQGKVDMILSLIPRTMYPKNLKEFLCYCEHKTIENFAETVITLYINSQIPHHFIWDMDTFKNYLKKITSKSIKKDMASNTYRTYVEKIIDCCYPSAYPYFGVMLALNIDYNSTWEDIFLYFSLCRYKPQYREKYRLRPARQVKTCKPLTAKMITNALEYTGFSKMKLGGNISYLYKDRKLLRGFIHILCGLQALREDYKFFDEALLKKIADDYWDKEYEKTLTEYDRRALNAQDEIDYFEYQIQAAENKQYYEDYEYYDREDCSEIICKLREEIAAIRKFVKEYEADYEDCIKYIYNGFWDKSDIWPNDEQCNELWLTYHNTHNVLLNTIAVLVHRIPEKNWGRIIAYYAVPERRIMLAAEPVLDKESGDPFVIHPKLQRPITDTLISGLMFSSKYKDKTVEQIDNEWEEANMNRLRHGLVYIIYILQSNGAELIKPDVYAEVYGKSIESDKNGGGYLGVDLQMIGYVLKNVCPKMNYDVREMAILLDKGYGGEEVYNYFQKKLDEAKKAEMRRKSSLIDE